MAHFCKPTKTTTLLSHRRLKLLCSAKNIVQVAFYQRISTASKIGGNELLIIMVNQQVSLGTLPYFKPKKVDPSNRPVFKLLRIPTKSGKSPWFCQPWFFAVVPCWLIDCVIGPTVSRWVSISQYLNLTAHSQLREGAVNYATAHVL